MASFILPVISGLAGLFGNRSQTQKTSGTSTTNSSGDSSYNRQSESAQESTGDTTSRALLSPLQQSLANLFTQGAINQYNQATDLSGYAAGGLKNINQASDLRGKAISNMLAARGLSFSPAATNAVIGNEQARFSEGSNFLNTLPLLQRQLQSQALQGLTSAFSTLPVDRTTSAHTYSTAASGDTGYSQQHNSSTTNQQGQVTTPGNPLGGFLGGIGAGLAGPSAIGGPGSNLNDIFAKIFGQSQSDIHRMGG